MEKQKNMPCADVESCKSGLKSYFHSPDTTLTKRFEIIYKLFGLNDRMIARQVGIDKSTMCRYRRGVFIPINQMKILISQAMSKLAKYQIDSAVIWGDSLIFEKWRSNKNG